VGSGAHLHDRSIGNAGRTGGGDRGAGYADPAHARFLACMDGREPTRYRGTGRASFYRAAEGRGTGEMTHCLGRANPRQATGGAHMRCKQIAISIARRVVHAVLPQSRETAWGITWKVTEFLGFFTSGKLRLLSRTGLVTAARGRHPPDIGETSTFSPSRNSRNLLSFRITWPEEVRP
jgi:hypothetical protein